MKKNDNLTSPAGDLVLSGGRVGFLLLHGLGGSPVELRFLAQGLNRAGYTVHAPLLCGHGGSPADLEATTWQDWYQSTEAALDRLAEHCDVIIAGGISVGAVLALRLAAHRQHDVQATALYAPTLWPNGWAIPRSLELFKLINDRFSANLFHFRERAPYGIKDERIRRFVLDSLQSNGKPIDEIFGRRGGVVLQFRWLVKDMMRTVQDVRQPTLIFHPRHDDQSDLRNTFKLQRKLGGLVETVVLDDSYHMVTLDRQRGLVIDRSVTFAADVLRRAEAAAAMERARRGQVAAE
jgi:carboxylesterase